MTEAKEGHMGPRTLIIGAGVSAEMTAKRMLARVSGMPGEPVVAVDDDLAKLGTELAGVPVAGTREDIPRLVEEFAVDQIVFAIPSAGRETRQEMYDICLRTPARIVTLPHILGTPISEVGPTPFRPINTADLLSRDEIVLDTDLVSGYVAGKTVLVTGGGGSIGSELCRQLVHVGPKRIVIFDIYENTAYELFRELTEEQADSGVEYVVEIGSIRDVERLQALFDDYCPEVVFHAAAHKHVPLMERNPREAVLNNVVGTLNVVRQADAHGCGRFVFISTDKAVNPTSVMGATKRLGEMIVQRYAASSDTIFAAVRFGNVLGSHGSVVPLFERQIASGGPVTVTHYDVTRYFMTIPEASRLVVMAGGMAKGGEIFVLNMGEPVRVYDLADRMVRMHGYEPGVNMAIEVTGLRPGEKLYEELLMDEEGVIPTSNPDIMVSTALPASPEEVKARVGRVELAAHGAAGAGAVKAALAQAVETYTITDN